MATSAKAGGDFLSNLGRIYGFYTGGFFAFVAVLAVLEQMGVPNVYIGYGFVFLTLAVYAVIGVLSRTMEAGEYYVAGRTVPAFYNGMATGADWMSAASFVGMAGSLAHISVLSGERVFSGRLKRPLVTEAINKGFVTAVECRFRRPYC